MSEIQSFLKDSGLPSGTTYWLLFAFILLLGGWKIPAIALLGSNYEASIENTSRFIERRGRGHLNETQSYLVKVEGKSYWLKSDTERHQGDKISFRIVPSHPDLQIIYWEWSYKTTMNTFCFVLFIFGVWAGIWGKGKYA